MTEFFTHSLTLGFSTIRNFKFSRFDQPYQMSCVGCVIRKKVHRVYEFLIRRISDKWNS